MSHRTPVLLGAVVLMGTMLLFSPSAASGQNGDLRTPDGHPDRYEFTVSDPTTWTGPWRAPVLMTRTEEPLYEYAYHEGNYSMPSSLSGARAMEAREAAESVSKQP